MFWESNYLSISQKNKSLLATYLTTTVHFVLEIIGTHLNQNIYLDLTKYI